ncbi:hypothetical protein KK062_27125 [Fulvivirgaceae bacterium PWU5]|uniref:Uncharacterized protein n=1 Tax=Dawidia cretensis TaxID=2782350 RepID=A0AAP2GW96_9BACT|nr:DUF6520 family protein [Dawidia cretensis]MBT1711945.1 hypothetical protein [Dawidia cretensis]
MKTKNLILGAIAVVFAIGGSFASALLVPAEFAKQGATCRPITTSCDVAGANLCTVRISNVNYPAFDDAACLIRTTTTSAIPVPAQFE